MRQLRGVHRVLLAWQRLFWVRVAGSVLWLAIVIGLATPVLLTTHQLHGDREAIFSLLTGPDQHLAGEQLKETGFITLDGRSIGSERFAGFDIMVDGEVSDPATVTWLLVSSETPAWVPGWLLRSPGTVWMIGVSAVGWGLLTIWLGLAVHGLYVLFGTAAGWFLLWLIGAGDLAIASLGIGGLAFTFTLLLRLMRWVLSAPREVPSVAGSVLLEATRTRLSLAFISILLILLPLIPIWLDPASPLRHRVQTMISRSLGTTFAIAACLTVVLACATVAFEIRDRQIWQVVSKPVGRFRYLLGKWVGILALNACILCVAGCGVFIFLQYQRAQPVAAGIEGELDRLAVEEEVLTARRSASPAMELLTPEQLDARVEARIDADPDLRGHEDIELALRRKIRVEMQQQFIAQQRSIPPMRGGETFQRTYEFPGLAAAKKIGAPIALRSQFHILSSSDHETYRVGLIFNDDPATRQVLTYVPTMTHVTLVPASLINDEGTLLVSIFNLYEPPPGKEGRGAVSFDPGKLQVLYRVGDFEGNFLRALIMLWIKLAFLAALGLAAATFLSFPVACLASFTVFAAGTLAPWLSESLQLYVPPAAGSVDWGNTGMVIQWAFENVIRGIATALVFVLDGFGQFQPTQRLVQGMDIPWAAVVRGALVIGVLWSSITLFVGGSVLRRRQLAIYSGHGG